MEKKDRRDDFVSKSHPPLFRYRLFLAIMENLNRIIMHNHLIDILFKDIPIIPEFKVIPIEKDQVHPSGIES